MKDLLLLFTLVAVTCAGPIIPDTSVYTYSYDAPQQSKQESRDHLGNVRGSYSVRFSHGGLLMQTYHFPSRPPVLRIVTNQLLQPADSVILLRNSKHSAFLVEMLQDTLYERAPVAVTSADSIVTDGPPVFFNSKVSPFLLQLRRENEASGGLRQQQLQLSPAGDALILEAEVDLKETPGDTVFINSKVSPILVELRQQTADRDGLIGRGPPIEGHESFVVDADGV